MSTPQKEDNSLMPVYEADEDSFFFTKKVLGELGLWITQQHMQLSDLSFLDMGTGSGYIAFELVKYGARNVTAVDNNPLAIKELSCVAELEELPIRVIQSDLFSLVPFQLFDCIIFNTPYLPNDEEKYIDPSLHGGPQGYEVALRFLEQARSYLTKNGRVYLLTSSLAQPEIFEKKAKQLGWSLLLIATHSLFFEQLLCYECTYIDKKSLLSESSFCQDMCIQENELQKRNINTITIKKKIPASYSFQGVLALGKRGVVSLVQNKSTKKFFVAKTQQNTTTALQPIVLESQQLKRVNKLGIGPQLEFSNKDVVIMQYLKGQALGSWLQTTYDPQAIIQVTQDILSQCVLLDSAGINKFEMTNPYKHIIICKSSSCNNSFKQSLTVSKHNAVGSLTCTMIDFERAKNTIRPKNVSQFKEYIKHSILPRLKEIGSDVKLDYFFK
ncbi:MAG: HemK2/MTQ2 family protein methyltransferase [Candidatus Nanoarchaeia archaeon]